MPDVFAADASRELIRLAREWDELGKADALWAALTDRKRKGGRWTVEEFLASGEREIRAELDAARSRYGLPYRYDRALDFGCGAGRLVHALAARFDSVVGVDVSQAMLNHARHLTADRTNVSLVLNTLPVLDFPSGSFDLVYTNLALQHVPSRDLIECYVRELVRTTAPGGIALLRAPHSISPVYRPQPRRRAYYLLRRLGVPTSPLIRRTPLQPMRMTPLPRARFEAAVRAAGGEILGVTPDGDNGYRYSIAGPSALAAHDRS